MKTDMMRGVGKGFSLLTIFCSLIPLIFYILFIFAYNKQGDTTIEI